MFLGIQNGICSAHYGSRLRLRNSIVKGVVRISVQYMIRSLSEVTEEDNKFPVASHGFDFGTQGTEWMAADSNIYLDSCCQ